MAELEELTDRQKAVEMLQDLKKCCGALYEAAFRVDVIDHEDFRPALGFLRDTLQAWAGVFGVDVSDL